MMPCTLLMMMILEYFLWSQNNIQRKAVADSRALEKSVPFVLGKYVPTIVSHVACSFLSNFLLLCFKLSQTSIYECGNWSFIIQ
jgi:hypothetical protein